MKNGSQKKGRNSRNGFRYRLSHVGTTYKGNVKCAANLKIALISTTYRYHSCTILVVRDNSNNELLPSFDRNLLIPRRSRSFKRYSLHGRNHRYCYFDPPLLPPPPPAAKLRLVFGKFVSSFYPRTRWEPFFISREGRRNEIPRFSVAPSII